MGVRNNDASINSQTRDKIKKLVFYIDLRDDNTIKTDVTQIFRALRSSNVVFNNLRLINVHNRVSSVYASH